MTAVLLKSTIALLLALAVVSFSRRSRASLRHLFLAAMFVFLLLLPLVQKFAPAVEIPVTNVILSHEDGEGPSPLGEGRSFASLGMTGGTVAQTGPSLMTLLLYAYAGGAVLLLAHLIVGIVRLHLLARNAEVWLDGTARLNEIAHRANIRRSALVVRSNSVAVPLTFGFVRSTVVLPQASETWSADELTHALRHELEHIRREDWLLQILARAACALYWAHPLVWIAWRRFCLEAERACDDAVLGDAEAAAYARQLVSLARNVHRMNPVPALAMASRSKLSTRVEAILDATQRRGPHGRSAAFAVSLALLGLLASIAPARIISAASDTARQVTVALADAGTALLQAEALVRAAEAGDGTTVKRMLDSGLHVDAVAPDSGTALIGAARGGHMELVDDLLARGADPNVSSVGDGSPLIAAAREGHAEVVELLLDRGARIDDIVPGDENALMQASMHGREELVRVLIIRGANVNARAIEGNRIRTPLSLARQYGNVQIVQMLLAAGADGD